MPTGGVDILVAAGVDAATAATISGVIGTGLTDAAIGAGVGGLTGEITGGGKGLTKGLEAGAITGLGVGVGGAALGGIGGSAIGGAVGGGLGSEVTGGNPLTGALEGGVGAGLSSAIGGTTNLFGTATPGTGAATGTAIGGTGGGAASAAPASVSGATGGDATFSSAPISSVTSSDLPPLSTDAGSTANTGSGPTSSSSFSNVSQTVSTPTVSAPSGSTPFSTAAQGLPDTPVGSSPSGSAFSPQAITNTTLGPSGNAASGISNGDIVSSGFNPQIFSGNPVSAPVGEGISGGDIVSAPGQNLPLEIAGGPAATLGAGSTPNTIATAYNHPSFSNIASAIGANASPLLAGAGLLGDVALNKKALPGQKELSDEAGSLMKQGQSLQEYLQTGTLPPGLKGALDEATNQAVATIKSQYAAHGMSGSSAEQDAIAQAQERAQASGSQMALQLLQTGISESEGASQLYQSIMNSALSQDNELGSAIGRFATSAAGGTPQANVSIGGKNVTV